MTPLEYLIKLNFQKAADFEYKANRYEFLFEVDHTKPGVYAWVNEVTGEILYIGKYGKSLDKRMREHKGNFYNGPESSQRKGRHLAEQYKKHRGGIALYYCESAERKIKYTNILGDTIEEWVSTEGQDEIALIAEVSHLYERPVLNKTAGG